MYLKVVSQYSHAWEKFLLISAVLGQNNVPSGHKELSIVKLKLEMDFHFFESWPNVSLNNL